MPVVRTCEEEGTTIGPRYVCDVRETRSLILKGQNSCPVSPQHNGAPAVKGDYFVTIWGPTGDTDLYTHTHTKGTGIEGGKTGRTENTVAHTQLVHGCG